MNKAFEDVIAEQGTLVYTNVGDSMYPFIRKRDLLIISKVKEPLKVSDVPLYKRPSGQYVLHRIIAERDGDYVLRGDNRSIIEYGVKKDWIIGVLTGIVRDGKTLSIAEADLIYQRQIARDVAYLLSCSVNETEPDANRCAQMSLPAVYRFSRAHDVTSAAAFALGQVIELPREFDQAKKKTIRKLALFDIERASIFRELEKAGIWYLPLKGIVLCKYYPKSAMREMTDNDILCDSERMADFKAIMERLGYTCDMFGEYNHDIYSKPPTLEFEIHSSLFFEEKDPELYAYFLNIKDRLRKVSDYGYQMTTEDFYLYILAHAYKHYRRGGIGLRSLADVYVFIKREGDSLDRDYLDKELERLGITDFELSIRTLSQKLFDLQPLNEAETKEFDYYCSSGASGTLENIEYNLVLDRLNNDDSAKSKRRYYARRVFPPFTEVKKNYPLVYRHKGLYPFLIVYRIGKGVFVKPKRVISEYKEIKQLKIDK